jgi:hypothetical protein
MTIQYNAPGVTSFGSDPVAVGSTEPLDDILRGHIPGAYAVNKFAYIEGATAANGDETVWAASGNLTLMTTADTFDITYNNTTDGSGQTGATVLLIDYLDANFELQQGTHVMGGTGTDTTAFSGLGINRVVVVASGSANANTNDITLADTAAVAGTQAIVPAGGSVTQQAVYHIPINHKVSMKNIHINLNKTGGGSAPKATFKMWSYNRLVATQFELMRFRMDASVENNVDIHEAVGFGFDGRDVIFWTIDTDTNDTDASIRFGMNLYEV